MRGLYFQCDSGISGDMTVAALLDLGADQRILLEGLKSLNVKGFEVEIKKIQKNNMVVSDYNVVIGRGIEQNALKVNRNIYDIINIIDNSSLTYNAKNIAKNIFKIKAAAGAEAHKKSVEEYYFHEGGALDSIADIVATAICIDDLEVSEFIVGTVNDGYGNIIYNGIVLPVPVPATSIIAKEHNLNLRQINIKGEMVTPTGAAILAGLKTRDRLPSDYIVIKTGYGNGKRDYKGGSILKIHLIEWEND
ncbi:nickel insertion protein [Anaerosphaera multitolerans]|uniref:DUF111 family protein n=1 Tax=Anaerosphaera multitolerans TaxID=2487351 RepID=A0A437S9I6_9FIRM|nr:nickel insertion protein [Anaerosphaera multitolerans]RVU55504.1 DUF111 family protein [Anaerosphaera multitolerans]